jgi:hypothetical protein
MFSHRTGDTWILPQRSRQCAGDFLWVMRWMARLPSLPTRLTILRFCNIGGSVAPVLVDKLLKASSQVLLSNWKLSTEHRVGKHTPDHGYRASRENLLHFQPALGMCRGHEQDNVALVGFAIEVAPRLIRYVSSLAASERPSSDSDTRDNEETPAAACDQEACGALAPVSGVSL